MVSPAAGVTLVDEGRQLLKCLVIGIITADGVFMIGYHHQRAELWKRKQPEQAAAAETAPE